MKLHLTLVAFLIPILALSQKPEVSSSSGDTTTLRKNVFKLGEVTITARHYEKFSDQISKKEMDEQNKMEVSRSINMLSGVTLTAFGQRNESMVSVRGFDLRAVPVYMDGIPVYVPYDGYVDLARFTTFDLSVIDVSKGFSSMLYGPNSLGGAINLISLKPAQKIEYNGSLGMINTNGYRGNVNIGSNLGKVYIQGGFSYLHRNSFVLSNSIKPRAHENGGERENSFRTDHKLNLKVGWTPKQNQEYVLGYINQQGEKGIPVYAGDDTLNSLLKKPRYWQTPYWNKETFYFLSNTQINAKNYIKSRIYYDIFKNAFYSYDDSTYTTQNKPYAFQSFYNDYTYGGIVEYGTTLIPKNEIKFSVQYKTDVHRENNVDEPVKRLEDNTISFAAEDNIRINNHLLIVPGISYDIRKNIQADDYNKTTDEITAFESAPANAAFNTQLGIFYTMNDHRIGLSVSHKTRFATIKDRYSYRMGTAIPNPELNPESANNFELNYTAHFADKVKFKTAVFYSNINDIITSISNVEPGKSQMQNAGKAEITGAEADISYHVLKNLLLGVNYTYIEKHNLSNPEIYITDIPKSKFFGYVQYSPIKQLSILCSGEYNSSRYSTSYGTSTAGFALFNTIVDVRVWKFASVEAGVNNVFDKNYSLVEGYPEEGRNFFVTLKFFNTK